MPSTIQKVKKRNGSIAEFNPGKISIAIEKAFLGIEGTVNHLKVQEIGDSVVSQMEKRFSNQTPSVEDIQDLVETELMKNGYFGVAKAYILYRYEHAKVREEIQKDTQEKLEKNEFFVVKRNGKKKKFSFSKLKRSLSWAVAGLEDVVDAELIAAETRSNLYENIPTHEIQQALILSSRSLIEKDSAYSQVAARLLIDVAKKDAIGRDKINYEELDSQYRQSFIENIKKGVSIKRLDPRLLAFDLELLSKKLDPSRDELLRYLGVQTLFDRYFISDPADGRILETPQTFWMRVAMGIAIDEDNKEDRALEFYDAISKLYFVPSTPTLFHAGTKVPQLSSCYLTTVKDSLDHIFKCISDNAQMSKWSGGVANDWTSIRATGAFIKGTGVESQGVIPFLKIANDTTVAINRSGRRRGATCVYLEAWHMDIEDFLELRKNTGDERRRTHDMNTANWIPDLFMKRVKEDGYWTLFSPEEVPDLHDLYGKKFEERYAEYEKMADIGKIKMFKRIEAKNLWKKMITMLFETGHPWMTWKDVCNIRSPQDHVGVIHSSNLCTEITLNTSDEETAVCNLGSLNMARHITDGKLDIERIKKTVRTAMRMLDNVIDINFYPTPEGKNSNLRHRPVGLGIMGYQDALYQMGIPFDSDASVEFADESMEAISYFSILISTELAKERGAYPSFRGSKWDRGILPIDTLDLLEEQRGLKIDVSRSHKLNWNTIRDAIKENGMRNSNCMACAPTATIANIAGVFPTIEPIFKNLYVKSNMSGEFTVVNQYLVDELKKLNLWNQDMLETLKQHDGSILNIDSIPREIRNLYKETFDIDPSWFVKVAAHRGKWIDQSQSLNLFIKGTSGKQISDVYMYAWEMGLKTTYYLRTMAATGVEKSTLDIMKQIQQQKVTQKIEEKVYVKPLTEKMSEKIPVVMAAEMKIAAETISKSEILEDAKDQKDELTQSKQHMLCKLLDPECEACQ